MAYIRVKKINDNQYAYLVENLNTKKGPRQKVKQYLGRVYNLDSDSTEEIEVDDLFLRIVLRTLMKVGFRKRKNLFYHNDLVFNSNNNTIMKKKKNVVIKVNEGYLCSFTLQRLDNFKRTTVDKDGPILAKYFLEAGLEVTESEFVDFYQNLKK